MLHIQSEEVVRTVDGMVVSRSLVFAQKQYELMQKGLSAKEAFTKAQEALVEEEKKALKEVKERTSMLVVVVVAAAAATGNLALC